MRKYWGVYKYCIVLILNITVIFVVHDAVFIYITNVCTSTTIQKCGWPTLQLMRVYLT